mmetsp:Transcript_58492/g.67461  ORF Transcript_58492/g.67461 Transcript_58492/m.67461 type:complete len:114 (-) Transcript_58492:192-533(-)
MMATNSANNPCLDDGGSRMDTTWMDTQRVRAGGGDGDGGDTIYEPVSCGGYDCTNSCVKWNGKSWIYYPTRLYEYWVPFLCAGYDVPRVVGYAVWTWTWVRMCDVLYCTVSVR